MSARHLECKPHEKEPRRERNTPVKLEVRKLERKRPSMKDKCYYIECQLCFESFSLKPLIIKHFDEIHPSQSPLLLKFVCLKCNKKFHSYQSIYQHKTVHSIEKSHKCSECDYKTARKRDLKLHIKHRHCAQAFKCKDCDKVFRRERDLERHVVAHKQKKKFTCDKCSNSFLSLRSLNKHTSEHIRTLVCSICGMPCTRLNFKSHMATHSKEMFNFLQKQDRNRYLDFYKECSVDMILSETWEKGCKLCLKKLLNQSEFKSHLRLHGEDLLTYQSVISSFECYACGVIFSSYKALEGHDREHEVKINS